MLHARKMVEANAFRIWSFFLLEAGGGAGSVMAVSSGLPQEEKEDHTARVFPPLSREAVFISGINLRV